MSLSCSLLSTFHFFSSVPVKLCWTHTLVKDEAFLGSTNFCSPWSLTHLQLDPSHWPGVGDRLEEPWCPLKLQGIQNLSLCCSSSVWCSKATAHKRNHALEDMPRCLARASLQSVEATSSSPGAAGHRGCVNAIGASNSTIQCKYDVFYLYAFIWVSVTEVSASIGSLLKILPWLCSDSRDILNCRWVLHNSFDMSCYDM